MKMMKCKVLIFRHHTEIEQGLNNWLLLNDKKCEIKHIVQSCVPALRIPIAENDPIKKERDYENAASLGTPSYIIVTIFYEAR